MKHPTLALITATSVLAVLCLALWWPYAIDLFVWHCTSPVRGVCWLVSLAYLGILCFAPIKVDGTRLTNLF